MNSADKEIGARIRLARELAGMSQADVASKVGGAWNQTTVSRTENGTRPLRASELAALEAIGIPTAYVLRGNILEGQSQHALQCMNAVSRIREILEEIDR